MPWYPTNYDRLILAEPTLGRYYPLDEAGGSGTPAYDRKSGYWLAVGGNTPSGIARNQPPLILADGRPVTGLTNNQILTSVGGASGAATAGLATGNAPWGLEAWVSLTDTGNYDIFVEFGTNAAEESGFISCDFGSAEVSSWNGAVAITGPSITDGKPHYLAGWFDGTNLRLVVDGKLIGTSADTFNIVALNFCIGAFQLSGSYQDAPPASHIAKVAYYTSFSVAQAMRHYLAGLHSGVLETVTPDAHTWPILAVNTSGGGSIVSGTATFISNSALAETGAQIEAPASVAANSVLAVTGAAIEAPATEQSNAALAESAALLVTPATLASNSVVGESAVILAPATLASNAALGESGQIVAPAALAGSSALAVSGAIILAPVALAGASVVTVPHAEIVAPATFAGNSQLIAASETTFISNSTLAVTGAVVVALCAVVAGSALAQSAAQVQAPAALAGYSAVAEAAQIVAAALAITEQGNSALVQSQAAYPGSCAVSAVALGTVTLTAAALGTVALSAAVSE